MYTINVAASGPLQTYKGMTVYIIKHTVYTTTSKMNLAMSVAILYLLYTARHYTEQHGDDVGRHAQVVW